ncbi:MAG: rod shape-determining protein [Patescibacteria group bacterium]
MFKNFFGIFAKDIGIDLGTTNFRVYIHGKGLVFNEPSIVAINTRNDQIIAIGSNALKMVGKAPAHISIVKPLDHGIISDFEVTEKMLKSIIEKVQKETFTLLPRARVFTTIPLDVTEVEKKSLEDVILQAGGREVFLVERPMAAAIGARLPIHDSVGSLIVELGGGLSEMALISLHGVVTWKSLKIGGESLNKNIMNYAREKFNILLGDHTTEEVKIKIGSAFAHAPQEMKIKGRDLITGLPREIIMTDAQLREAMMPILKTIAESIHDTIEATPPELVADIYERGLVLSGGGALLRGLDKLIQKRINIPIFVTDDPSTSVIRGLGLILEDYENLKEVIIPSARK